MSVGRVLALVAFSLTWALLYYVFSWVLIASIEATWLRAITLAIITIFSVAIYAAGTSAIFKKRIR